MTAGLAVPAVAPADHRDDRDPDITRSPSLVGTAQVGQRLDATGAAWWPSWSVSVEWRWLRCDSDDLRTCRFIDTRSAPYYVITASDLGKRLRAVLIVSNRDGYDFALTASTAAVAAVPVPAPPPVPVPVPVPIPEPVPVPVPVPDATPESTPGPLRMMRPVPTVRIRGWLMPGGAMITGLTVRAPRGARITARCVGRGCDRKVVRRKAKRRITRLKPLEGPIRAGTRLVIRVRKGNRIGKHTSIRIRRGRQPARRDRCLNPGSRKPKRCPAG